MIRKRILQALLVMVLLCTASFSHAITMNVSMKGNQATITMTATSTPTTTEGMLRVNFGDGSPAAQSAPITFVSGGFAPITRTWVTTHTYTNPGNYTLNGSWVVMFPPNPTPPLVVTQGITVVSSSTLSILPDKLPPGAVAEEYEEQLAAQGGTPRYSYRIVSGSLPAGLKLDLHGKISGTPDKLGRSRFGIEVRDALGQRVTQQYELKVGIGEAVIRITPGKQQVSHQGVLANTITYEYLGTAVQDSLYSSRGEFRVGSSILGYVNKGLTLNVRSGRARSSESVRVPIAVIRRAEQMQTNRITYSRSFKSKSLVGSATCTLLLSSSGELRITRMRVFFVENNRPRIVVDRSSRDLGASVQLNFTGTGLLKGYWEVDGRILQRVQKNLRFYKTITLDTPKVPPLPTYAEGTHRIRFVITTPSMSVPFPVAYYDVVEKEKSSRAVISLIGPENRETIQLSGTQFSWQQREKAATYLLSFFDPEVKDQKREEPIFSAYSKKSSYTLPVQVAEKYFIPGSGYEWLVLGMDEEGKIVGESRLRSFFVEASD